MMTKWQPIETAPKDGTRILVYGIWEGELIGKAKEADVWLCSGFDEYRKCFPVDGIDGYEAWVNDPTHWAPAPEKPETEE